MILREWLGLSLAKNGTESQCFSHSRSFEMQVWLVDLTCNGIRRFWPETCSEEHTKFALEARVKRLSVHEHISRNNADRSTLSQDIEECGFPSTRNAHKYSKSPRPYLSRDAVKQSTRSVLNKNVVDYISPCKHAFGLAVLCGPGCRDPSILVFCCDGYCVSLTFAFVLRRKKSRTSAVLDVPEFNSEMIK
jgi:hypothetical protein